MPLTQFIEEIHLGVIDDPHQNSTVVLTEKVTVCPSCRSLHSLRDERTQIVCVECLWNTTPETSEAA